MHVQHLAEKHRSREADVCPFECGIEMHGEQLRPSRVVTDRADTPIVVVGIHTALSVPRDAHVEPEKLGSVRCVAIALECSSAASSPSLLILALCGRHGRPLVAGCISPHAAAGIPKRVALRAGLDHLVADAHLAYAPSLSHGVRLTACPELWTKEMRAGQVRGQNLRFSDRSGFMRK